MDSSKRKVMIELLGGKQHHWPHFHPADVKSMLGKVRPADGQGYPETTLRGFSQWKTVQISIPDFHSLLSLTFVYKPTYSALELGQTKGMIYI